VKKKVEKDRYETWGKKGIPGETLHLGKLHGGLLLEPDTGRRKRVLECDRRQGKGNRRGRGIETDFSQTAQGSARSNLTAEPEKNKKRQDKEKTWARAPRKEPGGGGDVSDDPCGKQYRPPPHKKPPPPKNKKSKAPLRGAGTVRAQEKI